MSMNTLLGDKRDAENPTLRERRALEEPAQQ